MSMVESTKGLGAVLAATVLAAGLAAALPAPALADGMEPQPVAKAPVVRHHHPVRHHVARRAPAHPRIGYVIKHVHEDLAGPVYVQPNWPSCRYVLMTAWVRTVQDSYTGGFDCGS
ncbi:MAG: hypothetical protein U1E62_24830 [Alsobacter sp.]